MYLICNIWFQWPSLKWRHCYSLVQKQLPTLRVIPWPHPLFPREARRKFFFESLTISCAGGCRTHAGLDLGRRVEQRWPYYFLCRRLPHTRLHRPRLARRAEVALLFLVQEGRDTHAALDLGRRVEQRWPYYFSWRRLADAEWTHTPHWTSAGA